MENGVIYYSDIFSFLSNLTLYGKNLYYWTNIFLIVFIGFLIPPMWVKKKVFFSPPPQGEKVFFYQRIRSIVLQEQICATFWSFSDILQLYNATNSQLIHKIHKYLNETQKCTFHAYKSAYLVISERHKFLVWQSDFLEPVAATSCCGHSPQL